MNNINEVTSLKYLPTPDKSKNDKKSYKYLVLANGLQVLLVSDNKTECLLNKEDDDISAKNLPQNDQADEKLSAVALMVDVGAFSQPRGYQGLAHFLEHMIFMGSKKYPKENSFDTHITKYGGSNNACTDGEETLYYFEVAEKHLDSSMDYFAAQLKEPLLIEDSMTRERQAVESEFQLALNNNTIRCNQLLQSLANENYPHNSFILGNLKTLKEDIESDAELHRNLHEFYKRHYSSHRMYACIQSRLPLEKLEELAIKHFADINNNELPGLDFEQFPYKDAFRAEFFKEVFFVKPVENICQLNLTWVLPPTLKMYKCKPDEFLSHLLGYEGEGSLCAYLRKRLWALDVNAGPEINSMFTLFYLNITLTELGLKHLDEVLQATFSFIQLFNKASNLKEYYEELSFIKNNKFRYSRESTPGENVTYLVKYCKYYPSKDILTGSVLYHQFDEEQIQLIIDHLNEFNFNIILTSYQNYEGVIYDKKEKWFGTEYTSREIPQKWFDMWQSAEENSELYLPKANVFVAQDFRIFWLENGKQQLSAIPEKLMQTELYELWFRQDDKFLLPYAHICFHMMSSVLRQSARNTVIGSLYLDLVDHYLQEELYPANVAGITSSIYYDEKGVVLSVEGFNEKLHLVVEIMMKALISTKDRLDEKQLEIFKKQLQKNFYNSLLKPEVVNINLHGFMLKENFWLLNEKYKYISDISLEDIQTFAKEFTQEIYVQALIQGNLQQKTAFKVLDTVMEQLNCGKIKERSLMDDRGIEIPLGSHHILCRNLNPKDCNTVVANYYQIGPRTLYNGCILDFLIMILEAPVYNVLRTQQQLGYLVSCFTQINHGIMGFFIYVSSQETKHSSSHVEERIEAFRRDIHDLLEKLSLEDFENFKNSFIKRLEIKDVTLNEEVYRNWEEITTEDYCFLRKSKCIDILRTLKKQDIIDFWLTNEKKNLRKLSVQVIGVNTTPEECKGIEEDDVKREINLEFLEFDKDGPSIVNVEEFKNQLNVYPVTKTKVI
ncbi:nardilysin-like [Lucilia sericata]|uniref:nardilysin-like n=1 Tax=Lucilia sericata TaxID=13632 RepID=UPI0018A80DD5|nr:nardilysin-like [Lucilia sericata]